MHIGCSWKLQDEQSLNQGLWHWTELIHTLRILWL